jgi:CubicO group peptidase (beta-lactamase class C family)
MSLFPPPGSNWRPTIETAFNAAAAFAEANEMPWERDLAQVIGKGHFEPPPWNEIIGHVRPRGGPAGLIVRAGQIVAEWGDADRPDMTFSCAKSCISMTIGLALDDGLIPDVNAPIRELVDDGGFDSDQNAPITWAHMLQLSSEWEGELWGKPDIVDRNRDLKAKGVSPNKGKERPLQKPGAYWEYNDVRVNRLALSALRIWRKPLPQVLAERIMQPIGASGRWEWHGYLNSWVDIDGQMMPSVSGGAHWGGGMFISARDQARIGVLMARGGQWDGQQLISSDYIKAATTPATTNPDYGWLWWLNTGQNRFPSAPAHGYQAVGAGGNSIWIDTEADLVVVSRWLNPANMDSFLGWVYAAL